MPKISGYESNSATFSKPSVPSSSGGVVPRGDGPGRRDARDRLGDAAAGERDVVDLIDVVEQLLDVLLVESVVEVVEGHRTVVARRDAGDLVRDANHPMTRGR